MPIAPKPSNTILFRLFRGYRHYTMSVNNTSSIGLCNASLNHFQYEAPSSFDVFTGVLMILIIIISLAGNIMIFYAFVTNAKLRVVNNYFIMNLTVSDILTASLVIPFDANMKLYGLSSWTYGPVMCKVWTNLYTISVPTSILTLCVVSIDRYQAISNPLGYRAGVTLNKTKALILIAGIWTLSLFMAFLPVLTGPPLNVTLSRDLPPECPDVYFCYFDLSPSYSAAVTIVAFILPSVVMAMLYARMYIIITFERYISDECGDRNTKSRNNVRNLERNSQKEGGNIEMCYHKKEMDRTERYVPNAQNENMKPVCAGKSTPKNTKKGNRYNSIERKMSATKESHSSQHESNVERTNNSNHSIAGSLKEARKCHEIGFDGKNRASKMDIDETVNISQNFEQEMENGRILRGNDNLSQNMNLKTEPSANSRDNNNKSERHIREDINNESNRNKNIAMERKGISKKSTEKNDQKLNKNGQISSEYDRNKGSHDDVHAHTSNNIELNRYANGQAARKSDNHKRFCDRHNNHDTHNRHSTSHESSHKSHSISSHKPHHATYQTKVARHFSVIVLVQLVCWYPYSVQSLVYNLCNDCNHISSSAQYFLLTVGYLSCAINPYLYAYQQRSFRQVFNRMLGIRN